MTFLNLEACMPDMVHPVWRCGTDPMQVTMAVTKARLLIQRYPLGSSHSAGKHKSDRCILCGGPEESTYHFLLICEHLQGIRGRRWCQINKILEEFHYVPSSQVDLVKVLLDSSHLIWIPIEERRNLELLTRYLCFNLHNERAITIGSGSQYVAAKKMAIR